MLSTPEYKEVNKNVYLTLRNRISEHSKTIPQKLMEHIEKEWNNYNGTQRNILTFLFFKHQATIADLNTNLDVNEKTIRRYLNNFVADDIMEKLSKKQRDINALYVLKKD